MEYPQNPAALALINLLALRASGGAGSVPAGNGGGATMPPPAPGTAHGPNGQTVVIGGMIPTGQMIGPGGPGGAGGQGNPSALYASTVMLTAQNVTITAQNVTVTSANGPSGGGGTGGTGNGFVGFGGGGAGAAAAAMPSASNGNASAAPAVPPAPPGSGCGAGSGGGSGGGAAQTAPWTGVDSGGGGGAGYGYGPTHAWLRSKLGAGGGDLAYMIGAQNMPERAFQAWYQPQYQFDQRQITTPYGMTSYDQEASELQKRAGWAGGIGSVGGAAIGALVGLPFGPGGMYAGAMIGGGVGGAAGNYIGSQLSQDASRKTALSELVRLKSVADYYSGGEFRGQYDPIRLDINAADTQDKGRGVREKIALTQAYLSAEGRVPGSYTVGEVRELQSATRSEKFPEGNASIYNLQIGGGVAAQGENPSLFGTTDAYRRREMSAQDRQSFRIQYAMRGDFMGFNNAFSARPSGNGGSGNLFPRSGSGETDAMREEYKEFRMRGIDVQTRSAVMSFEQAGIGREAATGAGGERIADLQDAQSARQAQIAQQLYAEASVLAAATSTPEGRLAFENAMAKAASMETQAQQTKTGAIRTRYGSQEQLASTALQTAQTDITRQIYRGTESGVTSAYAAVQSGQIAQADTYSRMAEEERFSPEERARYRSQAEALITQATFDTPRQEGGFRQALRGGELGVRSATAQAEDARAGMFGGIDAITQSRMTTAYTVYGGQTDLLKREQAGEFGPRSQSELLQIQERLIGAQRAQAEAIEQATRSYYRMNIAVAQTAQSIAGSRTRRALGEGAGGVEAFGMLQTGYEAAQTVATRAAERVTGLRARGVAEDNLEMQQAVLAAEEAQTSAHESGLGRARAPFSIGLRRQDSNVSYQTRVLSSVPGTYGNIRGALKGQMQNEQGMYEEIKERREAHKAANGGQLSEAEEFEYQEQLQNIGMRQADTFRQLSTGWESRLISQTINSPGSSAYIMPAMSMKAAVNGGVINPAYGSRDTERGADGVSAAIPAFLEQAHLYGTIAGATATPQGFAATAMTGGGGGSAGHQAEATGKAVAKHLSGLRLSLDMPLPEGGTRTVGATLHAGGGASVSGTRSDTSPAGIAETVHLSGAWVPRQ